MRILTMIWLQYNIIRCAWHKLHVASKTVLQLGHRCLLNKKLTEETLFPKWMKRSSCDLSLLQTKLRSCWELISEPKPPRSPREDWVGREGRRPENGRPPRPKGICKERGGGRERERERERDVCVAN